MSDDAYFSLIDLCIIKNADFGTQQFKKINQPQLHPVKCINTVNTTLASHV